MRIADVVVACSVVGTAACRGPLSAPIQEQVNGAPDAGPKTADDAGVTDGGPVGTSECPGGFRPAWSWSTPPRDLTAATHAYIREVGPSTDDLAGVHVATMEPPVWHIDLVLLDSLGREAVPRIPLWRPADPHDYPWYNVALEGGIAVVSGVRDLRAFSIADGSVAWVWQDAMPAGFAPGLPGQLAVSETTVYAARNGGTILEKMSLLIAADLRTGRTLWQKSLAGTIWQLIVDEKGALHVGYEDPVGAACHLSLASDGRTRFLVSADGLARWAASGGVVYRQSSTLVRSEDGALAATLPAEYGWSPVSIGERTIFFTPHRNGLDAGPLIAADLSTGAQLWNAPLYGDAFAVSSADGDTSVLFMDPDGVLHVRSETGKELLALPSPVPRLPVGVLREGRVLFGGLQGSDPIYACDLPLRVRPADRGWSGWFGSPGGARRPRWVH